MSRRLSALCAAASLALVTACGGASSGDTDPGTTPADEAVGAGPLIISHRGGAAVYPEHSLRAYRESAADGYLPEMDLRALADGTIVCIHDDTVDRTMTGVSGKVSDLTLDQWESARVVSPTGGASAAPVTWDEVLDDVAGDVTIVPELKASEPEVVAEVVDELVRRKLQDDVIVQSFDWDVVQQVADAGLPALYLFGQDQPRPASEILAAGVEYVGPSWKIDPRTITELADAGLQVVPYTVNDVDVAEDVLDAGAAGFFTDDPWTIGAALRER